MVIRTSLPNWSIGACKLLQWLRGVVVSSNWCCIVECNVPGEFHTYQSDQLVSDNSVALRCAVTIEPAQQKHTD